MSNTKLEEYKATSETAEVDESTKESLVSKGKSKLRSVAAAGAIGLASFGAPSARASTTFTFTAGTKTWFFTGIATSSGDTPNISEGSLTTPGDSYGDAFDGALYIKVDGTDFQYDAPAVVTANSVTGTDTLSGLDTQMQYYFFGNRPLVRAFYQFTNNTASTITATATFEGDYGSDDSTVMEATSDGDAIPEDTDKWYISSDDGDGDPVLTLTRYGGAATETGTDIQSPAAGNDEYEIDYNLSVAPGETVSLLFFQEMSASVAAAQTGAADFDSLSTLSSASLLTGISAGQQATILNYKNGASGIPLIKGNALISLAAALGLFGAAGLSRRRKPKKA